MAEDILVEGTEPDKAETEVDCSETVADNEAGTPAIDYVRQTLSSGVAPLEMRFAPIFSCNRNRTIAYRSFTYMNSILMGVVSPEKYSFATDSTDRGVRLAEWNVYRAVTSMRKMQDAGRNVSFVTARCPARLALLEDTYAWMQRLIEKFGIDRPEKLCLEFPQSILFEEEEKARLAVLNMKLLNVKTMMSGCGAVDCPVSKLINIPVDYVLVDSSQTVLADSKEKGNVVKAFLGYLNSMGAELIADGVMNDEQVSALNEAECLGYIPSPSYKGTVSVLSLRMSLDDIVNQLMVEGV